MQGKLLKRVFLHTLFCNQSLSLTGGSKELKAIRLERKTLFDYNKLASANCKNNQKEVITK